MTKIKINEKTIDSLNAVFILLQSAPTPASKKL